MAMYTQHITPEQVDQAVRHAAVTLLWITPVEHDTDADACDYGLSLLDYYNDQGIAPRDALSAEAWDRLSGDVLAFITHHEGAVRRALRSRDDYDEESIGHDYVLTRNGHGAGFWDRGLGIAGDILTRGAHFDGEQYVEVGDDGLVYIH